MRSEIAMPVESYTDERKAEFLLNNAIDAADYEHAVKEVANLDYLQGKLRIGVQPNFSCRLIVIARFADTIVPQ